MKKFLIIIFISIFTIYNIGFGADDIIDINGDNKEYADLLFKGYDYYQNKDNETAVYYYEKAYNICGNTHDCEVVEKLLISTYYILAKDAYEADDTETTIKRYKKLLILSPNEFSALINIGVAYIWKDPDIALFYFQEAKKYAKNQEDIELAEKNIQGIKKNLENFDELKEEKAFKALNKTNDTYIYKQYYMYYLDIFKAWEKIPYNDNFVTIAIIDDGIQIDHPDLKDNIWTNNPEKINGVDDDKNGYIDDYYGRNFIKNSNDMTPSGNHGTIIAGIIGATSNNNEGISGIIPKGKIKLMPLIVFGVDGSANSKDVVVAINYAIDKGADIINLSFLGDDFKYSDDYDEAISRANNEGIVIVAAAGNGDETQDSKVGINTTNIKLSPVCNGKYEYSVIGVGALDKTGNVSSWSNYGDCVDVYTYGELIFSTSNTGETLYAIGSGTSFSTPIIAGIIGLGHVIYGKVGLSDIYQALKGSLSGNQIDVINYLNRIGTTKEEIVYDNIPITSSVSLGSKKDGSDKTPQAKTISDLEMAIQWMYENGLTIYKTPNAFMSNRYLTREQASKFFVQFANSVLQKDKGSIDSYDIYSDIGNADPTLIDFIIFAKNMGLFKGNNGKFKPFSNLSQTQAIAVTIRMLDGYLEEPEDSRYINYFYRAQKYGFLSGTNIKFESADKTNISRGDIALILYKAYKYYNNIDQN